MQNKKAFNSETYNFLITELYKTQIRLDMEKYFDTMWRVLYKDILDEMGFQENRYTWTITALETQDKGMNRAQPLS